MSILQLIEHFMLIFDNSNVSNDKQTLIKKKTLFFATKIKTMLWFTSCQMNIEYAELRILLRLNV